MQALCFLLFAVAIFAIAHWNWERKRAERWKQIADDWASLK